MPPGDDVLASLEADLKPAIMTLLTAERETFKASLPGPVRLFFFPSIWLWLTETVVSFLIRLAWKVLAKQLLDTKLGTIVDTLSAILAVLSPAEHAALGPAKVQGGLPITWHDATEDSRHPDDGPADPTSRVLKPDVEIPGGISRIYIDSPEATELAAGIVTLLNFPHGL
jgi:hypothetical protein